MKTHPTGDFQTPFGTVQYHYHMSSVRLIGQIKVNGVHYNLDAEIKRKSSLANLWAFDTPSACSLKRLDKSEVFSRNAFDKVYNSLPNLWKEFLTPELVQEGIKYHDAKKIVRLRNDVQTLRKQLKEKEDELADLCNNSTQILALAHELENT